jgi:hypothetical protein
MEGAAHSGLLVGSGNVGVTLRASRRIYIGVIRSGPLNMRSRLVAGAKEAGERRKKRNTGA